MHIPYFGLIMIFVIWLTYEIRKNRRKDEMKSKNFWDRELEASSVRRKSTDSVRFISFDSSVLPDNRTDDEVNDLCTRIMSLTDKKIADLSAYTNTDLKMEYGVANFTELSEADSRFTALTPLLGKLSSYLYENNRRDEARRLCEYSVSIGIHTSAVMMTLAKINSDLGNSGDNLRLAEIARNDRSCQTSLTEKLEAMSKSGQ